MYLAATGLALALEVPRLQGYVSDYAAMISPPTKSQILDKLKALAQSDSTQIFVLTVPSLDGDSLEGFATRVFESWKVGQAHLDNGVILIVAQKERKIRIEVGRGLEGKLSDLVANTLIEQHIKPKFKTDDFDGGFVQGVDALIAVTRGEFSAAQAAEHRTTHHLSGTVALVLFLSWLALMIFVVFKINRRGRGGRKFIQMRPTQRGKVIATEMKSGWYQASGLCASSLVALMYLMGASLSSKDSPSMDMLWSTLGFGLFGAAIGLFIKAISTFCSLDTGGYSGHGGDGRSSDAGSSSSSNSSSSSSSSSDSGGGGSSAGGGSSSDY
jgi:uncharacterized protein